MNDWLPDFDEIKRRILILATFKRDLAALPTAPGGPDGDYRPKSEAEGS